MPNTETRRDILSFTASRAGNADITSVTGPTWPPHKVLINAVAYSSALRVLPKSTPRSKR